MHGRSLPLLPSLLAVASLAPGLALALPALEVQSHLIFSHSRLQELETVTNPIFGVVETLIESTASAWSSLFHGANAGAANAQQAGIYSVNVSSPVFVTYGDSDNGGSTGVPDDPYSDIAGYTHYNIAFWTVNGGPQDNAYKWHQASKSVQKKYKQAYNDAGVKLMVSAFGASDKPQSSGRNAVDVATSIAKFVIDNNLDGVDIDYEEEDLFDHGKALPWLIALQRHLRQQLPRPQYIITHAPIAPWFSWTNYADGGYSAFDNEVGDTVDWYNVQFYNQGLYDDCNGLLFNSGGWCPDSSLFQINSLAGVPLERLVIGKPAIREDADNQGSGYMDASTLGECIKQAKAQNYSGSVMLWEYPHATADLIGKIKTNAGHNSATRLSVLGGEQMHNSLHSKLFGSACFFPYAAASDRAALQDNSPSPSSIWTNSGDNATQILLSNLYGKLVSVSSKCSEFGYFDAVVQALVDRCIYAASSAHDTRGDIDDAPGLDVLLSFKDDAADVYVTTDADNLNSKPGAAPS
ncbi:glycoside hydrolase family 18 protein [Tilletiaria anomala UBC 951]|uniref:Glycoside hydrolase family 18 protein n=1 Tax=Tilletiaria anomala (strain ATCC 24038 / CBS 436.72 / UBC 951) TaxID=1037660 RepID=A0A066WH63_TILAU|nr:glycoside hydrolase family 18 protein [Tilletiaria anomala UBC 951]KDN50379.1 glycoside hydrolase family 18 protein [Tilletiaria anomala UBC 951]